MLAPLGSIPASALNQSAVAAFVEETVYDLVDRATRRFRRPLDRMARRLSRLRWSSRRIRATVDAFPAAERVVFAIPPSHLCADAGAFAANPRAAPDGTRHWVSTFVRASARADRIGTRLGAVLGKFDGPRDAAVLSDIAVQASRLLPAAKHLETTEEIRLLRALGLHG